MWLADPLAVGMNHCARIRPPVIFRNPSARIEFLEGSVDSPMCLPVLFSLLMGPGAFFGCGNHFFRYAMFTGG